LEEAKIDITLEVYLYGALKSYAPDAQQKGFARILVKVPEGQCLRDLLARLQMPTTERGITFINGNLSALPGFQPDLGHIFQDGDRVAFFDLRSMWPHQYRSGAQMTAEMTRAIEENPEEYLHHQHEKKDKDRS